MSKVKVEDTLEFKRAKKIEEIYNKAIVSPLAEDSDFQSVILTLYYTHENYVAAAFESAKLGCIYEWSEEIYAIYGSPFDFSRMARSYLKKHPESADIVSEIFAYSE